jgi:hypothetical protein
MLSELLNVAQLHRQSRKTREFSGSGEGRGLE